MSTTAILAQPRAVPSEPTARPPAEAPPESAESFLEAIMEECGGAAPSARDAGRRLRPTSLLVLAVALCSALVGLELLALFLTFD